MRSEQILTQQHLIVKRMQPLPFINLWDNLTIFLFTFIRSRILIAIVHFYSLVCKCTFGRYVLIFNLRRALFWLWIFIFLLNFVFFFLDIIVVIVDSGIFYCIHILCQIRMTTTGFNCGIEGGKLRPVNNNRICFFHFKKRNLH